MPFFRFRRRSVSPSGTPAEAYPSRPIDDFRSGLVPLFDNRETLLIEFPWIRPDRPLSQRVHFRHHSDPET